MRTELLTSKLYIPPLRPGLVPRPRLIQLLNERLHKKHNLNLGSAPAGFGKTTLRVAWLKQINLPAAWLYLDEADNDLPRFLPYLGAAFRQVDEQISAPLLSALQSQQLPVIEKFLTAFLNEIAHRIDALILVLDDFHLITPTAVLAFLEFLLYHNSHQLRCRMSSSTKMGDLERFTLPISRPDIPEFVRS